MLKQVDAEKMIKLAHFRKYQELGGELELFAYGAVAMRFVMECTDAFICGSEPRGVAWKRFCKWLKQEHRSEDARRVFQSIDMVTPFT